MFDGHYALDDQQAKAVQRWAAPRLGVAYQVGVQRFVNTTCNDDPWQKNRYIRVKSPFDVTKQTDRRLWR